MGVQYQVWLNRQIDWLNTLQKVYYKTCRRYVVAILIVMTAGLAALGWFVGGFKIALQNAFIGLILGILISLVCWAVFRIASPRRCYLKSLKKQIKREFPEELDRERFAKAMQEMLGHNITWESPGGRTGKVEVVKEYAILFWANSVTVVKLGQVERMELDAYEFNVSVGGAQGTVRGQQEHFVIRFYYYAEGVELTSKKKGEDKRFNFPARELRDRVAQAIEAVQENCPQ